jgi:hypothetical protein
VSLLENGYRNGEQPWLELDHIKLVTHDPACFGEYLITTYCVEAKAANGWRW